MPSAYRKDIACTIRYNMKRFVSIAVICALGVTMFCGLRAACQDLRASADGFFDAQSLFDMRVLSTLGLDEEDVAALEGVEGVARAEGGYMESTYVDVGDGRASVDVRSLSPSGMNEPYLVDGRLPESADEVVVSASFLSENDLELGDAVELAPALDESEAVFARHPYTIVGSAIDPMDINNPDLSFRSTSGADFTFVVSQDAVTADAYTVAYVEVDGTEGLACYSSAYEQRVGEVQARIEDEVRADREAARTSTVKGDAQAELDDAREEYEQERADAEAELADGLAQIEDGQAEIDSNRATLEQSERDLEAGWAEYRNGAEELADQRVQAGRQFATAQQTLDENRAQLESGQAQVDDGLKQVAQAEGQLASAESELVGRMNEMGSAFGVSVSTAEEAHDTLDAMLGPVQELEVKLTASEKDVEAAQQKVSAIRDEIKGLDPTLDADRIAELEGDLEAAKSELDDKETIRSALQGQFGHAMEELPLPYEALKKMLADIEQIVSGKAQAAASRAQLEASAAQIADGWEQLEAGQAELDSRRASAYAALDSAERTLADARAELVAGEAQLPEAWALLEEAQAELDAARAEWEDGRAEADAQFADAEQELADAQADIDAIEAASWYVQDRSSVPSYASVESDADSIEAIGTLFPAVFLIVAVLVALTTITRMVEEERGLIGTYKALGYRNREIYAKYLAYALLACAAGCVLGLVLGFVALPAFLFSIFGLMYVLPGYPVLFEPTQGALAVAIFLVAIVGTAWVACKNEVRQTPAALMRPKAPKSGSRILLERVPFLWSRMSFLSKVTARNLFRYKRRFLMTVAGIMGCTALIVCGFIIHDSVAALMPEQYGRITRYDILAVTNADDLAAVAGELEQDERVDQVARIHIDTVSVKSNGDEESVQLVVVPDGVDLGEYVVLEEAASKAPLELPEEGGILTQNAAEVMGISAGATASVQDSSLDQADVSVEAVAANYLGNYLFMGEGAYERAFGALEENGVLVLTSDACTDEIGFADELADDGRFLSVTSTHELSSGFDKAFTLINAVVVIVLAMAAALAFTVLFTLSTTNISERERELATIKVLGFRPAEVHHYVNKETLILTVIGIVAGLPFGYVLGDVLLQSLKMPAISFLTTISPVSYVVSAVLPFAFALMVNLITNRTLNKIDMISALKSVE